MNEELLLAGLRTDLGISAKVYDDRLRDRIRTAQAWISEEGITLEDTAADRDLVVMYAGYLWRSRMTGEAMPRMLRYALNNRLFAEKGKGAGA